MNNIVPLTKVENPRCRSWKLRVPARLQDYMLSVECYPVGWKFRKWDFHGPKQRKTTAGQRTQERVEPVPRLVSRPSPEGPPVVAVTEAGVAVTAAAEVSAEAASEHSHGDGEMEQSGW